VSVDLRRTYIGVPEQLLHRSEVGTTFEEVGRVGMTQSVGMECAPIGKWMTGEDSPRVPGGQSMTTGVHEKGFRHFVDEGPPSVLHVVGNGVTRRLPEWEPAHLGALAEHSDGSLTEVDGVHIQATALAHA
jgi:hypothetical protein